MPKSISKSVGAGGANTREDVLTVQYLLNCVPIPLGGPSTELVLDGWIGPKTNAAITQFQKVQVGKSDGRVDAGGTTFGLLKAYDPYPSQKLNLPSCEPSGKSNGKMGGTPATGPYDPWGYYNPASPHYMDGSKQPPDNYAGKNGSKGGDGGGGGGGGDNGGVKGGGGGGGGGGTNIGGGSGGGGPKVGGYPTGKTGGGSTIIGG